MTPTGLFSAVWAVPRPNDRYNAFQYQYKLLGEISQHLEDREYLATFRMPKDRVAEIWR